MSTLDDRLAKGDLDVGPLWVPQGTSEADALVDIPLGDGRMIRVAFCANGLAIENPAGQVWQPAESNKESLTALLKNAGFQPSPA